MVPAVQTQFKCLHLFHFGNLCISVILLLALFFPQSSQEKSVRRVVGHKSNLKATQQEHLNVIHLLITISC